MPFRSFFLAAAITCAALPVAAQVVYSGQCRGAFAGVPLEGGLRVTYLTHSDTYEFYGVFFDPQRNRYDFEVVSNRNGGVGGAWVNGARHRETRIEMRYQARQLVIRELHGSRSGEFACS